MTASKHPDVPSTTPPMTDAERLAWWQRKKENDRAWRDRYGNRANNVAIFSARERDRQLQAAHASNVVNAVHVCKCGYDVRRAMTPRRMIVTLDAKPAGYGIYEMVAVRGMLRVEQSDDSKRERFVPHECRRTTVA